MQPSSDDASFAGTMTQLYEQYLVPLIFEHYAADLAARVALRAPARVLEVAAGTGVVTRHRALTLAASVPLVATDLTQPMLDQAAAVGVARPVEWRQADAMQLPFPDASFDVVVCQFGVMFFPDKVRAFAEARRVLRPDGQFLFSVWDRIEHNVFADAVTQALATVFPDDPPHFLVRTPHGYHDPSMIARDLTLGGFPRSPEVTTLPASSRADAPHMPAVAYCQGTPLRGEIETRDPARLVEATHYATQVIASRFGAGAVEGKMQAHVIAIDAR
jgi:SAM-dependent methyltransferase